MGGTAVFRFKDPDSGKTLIFLTNNTALPALTIAALYKSCWQVALFFSSFTLMSRSTLFYRFCRCPFSKKPRFHAPCGTSNPKPTKRHHITNWI